MTQETFKLLPSEDVLPDDGNMFPTYVYIVDNVFKRADIFDRMTVGEYKKAYGAKEIRRCDLFGHPNARLGDRVTE